MRPRLQTRVLTSRIAHLIRAHGAQPYQILAITFTNKVGQRGQGAKEQQAWGSPALRLPAPAAALLPRVFTCHPAGDCSMLAALCPPPHGQAAKEMKERLAAMLGDEAGKELFAGTFHRCGQAAGRGWVRSGAGRTWPQRTFTARRTRYAPPQPVLPHPEASHQRPQGERAGHRLHNIRPGKGGGSRRRDRRAAPAGGAAVTAASCPRLWRLQPTDGLGHWRAQGLMGRLSRPPAGNWAERRRGWSRPHQLARAGPGCVPACIWVLPRLPL